MGLIYPIFGIEMADLTKITKAERKKIVVNIFTKSAFSSLNKNALNCVTALMSMK